jgi:hypothetical protein
MVLLQQQHAAARPGELGGGATAARLPPMTITSNSGWFMGRSVRKGAR